MSNSSKRLEYDQLRRLRQKRPKVAARPKQSSRATWSKASNKAETPKKDLIIIAIFIVLILITMFGFH